MLRVLIFVMASVILPSIALSDWKTVKIQIKPALRNVGPVGIRFSNDPDQALRVSLDNDLRGIVLRTKQDVSLNEFGLRRFAFSLLKLLNLATVNDPGVSAAILAFRNTGHNADIEATIEALEADTQSLQFRALPHLQLLIRDTLIAEMLIPHQLSVTCQNKNIRYQYELSSLTESYGCVVIGKLEIVKDGTKKEFFRMQAKHEQDNCFETIFRGASLRRSKGMQCKVDAQNF
jgi:hypothetical protein